MKIKIKLLVLVCVSSLLACNDEGGKERMHKQQLQKLIGKWNIVSAIHGTTDRTSEFKNPDFTLTVSGAYDKSNPRGPYTYLVEGKLPFRKTPWAEGEGTWTFGDDELKEIIRDDNVVVTYNLELNSLVLTFTCTTCDTSNSGRNYSVEGEWSFILSKI
jgi:hypothetical protein